jgi:hypothetical protein
MGWEFAALYFEDAEEGWRWVWRRIADDSGKTLQESPTFEQLDECVEDAKRHGFDEDDCGSLV